MKIKTVEMPLSRVLSLPRAVHKLPRKCNLFWRSLVRLLAESDLKETGFTWQEVPGRPLSLTGSKPALILMNHSCFMDLEIVSKIFFPKPYAIVCTSDGFVGKEWLMRRLGCIPTEKFVPDQTLLSDMRYALDTLKTDVLMYPEASYSFDGRETPLPRQMGRLLKMLNAPVVMIKTEGAFARDPLYNGLKKRKVHVSAAVSCLLTTEEIAHKTVPELDGILDEAFRYDHFAWQRENGVSVSEPFRAEGLNRILYRCAACGAEGHMESTGTTVSCRACGKVYELLTDGSLRATSGQTEFSHVPDWYAWERECVKKSLEDGTYALDVPVKIGVMVDRKAIYMVGEGRLTHTAEGFRLTGCGGELDYRQRPLASYGLYADYFWYEIGDVICIGKKDCLFYCFPQGAGDVVAKARMATEELFKLKRFGRAKEASSASV